MELAMIGLGKMGGPMVARLLRGGHRVVVYNRGQGPVDAAVALGAESARPLEQLVEKLATPRVLWFMLPEGQVTDDHIFALAPHLAPGDIVIDGGNSRYTDTLRRAERLTAMGLRFVDVGTSGGIWGESEGYSLMIGGEAAVVDHLRPIFATLAPAADCGWGHVGPHGAGHYVKMVHNGIEYGMMEAFAEGFDLLRHKSEFDLDLHQVARIWQHGSVVRAWLLDLIVRGLGENPTLEGIAPYVTDSGEGRWTAIEGIEQGVPLPIITVALQRRFMSREASSFANRLLAVMRQQFGGHAVQRAETE